MRTSAIMRIMVLFAVLVSLCRDMAFGDYVYIENTYKNGRDTEDKIRKSGLPAQENRLYGYRKTGEGPGDSSFNDCVQYATTNRCLLMVIYGNDNCDLCSNFAYSFNNDVGRSLAIGGSVNAYFRGSSKACNDAFDFFKTHLREKGGPKGTCHIIGFWGLGDDGQVYQDSDVLPTTYEGAYKTFQKKYSDQAKKWSDFKKAHKVRGDARFRNKNTKTAQLQATEKTATVYVPLVREGANTTAENDFLIAAYPDGLKTTNSVAWAAGVANDRKDIVIDVSGHWQEGMSVILTLTDSAYNTIDTSAIHYVVGGNGFSFPDMEFDESGEWGQWTLCSEDSWNAATQKVYAANTYSQPDTNNNARVESVVMGIPISPSNRYEVVYTNDITFFADSKATVDIEHEFEFTVTNLVTTVYTNAVAAFDKLQKADEDAEALTVVFPGELQVVTNYVAAENVKDPENDKDSKIGKNVTVTNFVYGVENLDDANPVEWEWARTTEEKQVECFTNKIYYVETNAEHAVGTAVTNAEDLVVSANGRKSYYLNKKATSSEVEIPVSESFASNCVYAVTPQLDSSAVTNLYSSEAATFSGVVTVTNVTTLLPCDANHAKPSTSEPVAKADDPHPVVKKFKCTDLQTYYTVQSIWDETEERPYECFGTNRTFYVQLPGNVTNEDVVARVPVPKAGDWATTNFYFYALTNGEHTVSSTEVTWTNFEATAAVDCTNFYYTVATNEYQHGMDDGGRSGKDIQSFVLKVTGGAVWNAEAVAFAASVFDSKEFADWCESNKVVTLLQECSDPATGASLFSHTVAANGHSGSAFLSQNSLDETQCEQPPASNVFEVALYRPSGTLAAVLEPYMSEKGVCDKDENMARLRELVVIAGDLTEPQNNYASAPFALKAHYGVPAAESEFQTLSVSDKKDVFELFDVPANEFVSIAAPSFPESLYAGEKPQVSVWRSNSGGNGASQIAAMGEDPEGNPVWRFTEADRTAGLFAEVTAWTAGNSKSLMVAGGGIGSMFLYPLVVQAAEEYKGVVSFACPSNRSYDVDSETDIELKVARTGYTGAATATVTLTECQLPQTSYSWVNANNSTNITWQEGEYGEKSFFVKVKNVLWEDSVSNLVFTITSASGASLDGEKSIVTIGIQQEDDENALTGQITVSSPAVAADQVQWLEGGVSNKIVVSRDRVYNEVSRKWEARDAAVAEISATGGAQLTTNRLEWLSGARVGERDFWITMPEVGKSGEQPVTLTIVGKDVDGNRISKPAVIRIRYMVIPQGAPKFVNGIDAEAYQYVPFAESAYLAYQEEELTIAGFELLSGSLPDGLAASTDEFGLKVSGTPTGTNSTEATYQITLRKKNGDLVKTMPVSVKITSKALGGTHESGGADNAVIPAFADRRVWQYLPMTNEEGRLAGLLNLSAATKGSLSARCSSPQRTVQFLAPALDGVEADEAFGGYRAKASMEKAGYKLDASFTTDGSVFAELSEQEEEGKYKVVSGFASEANATPWAFVKDGAKAWQGCYTVVFGQAGDAADANAGGVAAISLRMNSPAMVKTGRVTYNGVLPNGRPLNGTTAFLPPVAGAAAVKVPVLWNSAADSLSAMLVATNTGSTIAITADPAVTPFWTTGGGERSGDLAPTGGIFASGDVAAAWRRDFGTGELAFKYDGKAGSATVVPDGKGIKPGSSGSADKDGFELESIALNRVSGMATGSVLVRFGAQRLSVPFRGAVLSGNKECFMKGTAWYTAVEGDLPVRKSVTVEIVPADPQ